MKEKPTMVVVPIEDWEEYQELKKKKETEETRELELEIGKDYVSKKNEEEIIIDRKGNYGNVCFLNGEFVDDIACIRPFLWREATEEEVIQAFEKECVRRLGEDWKEVKLKTHANGGTIHVNTGRHKLKIIKNKHKGWIVWNKNGIVYYEGKWAEKLEEPKFGESLGSINRPFYIVNSKVKRCDTMQTKDNLPTKELAEGVLALTQLLSFRHDVWEKGGKPEGDSFAICFRSGKIVTECYDGYYNYQELFRFKNKETAEWFLETHKELLTEYQNKLIK